VPLLCVTAVKPLISSDNPAVESLVGRDVTLTCVLLSGTPTPKITWTRLGELINSTADRVVHDSSGSLNVRNVSLHDEGEYVCTASNVAGTSSTSVTLDVLGMQQSATAIDNPVA